MKDIDERATAMLLAALDIEINKKCMELTERQREIKMKKIFFSSCLFLLFSFTLQIIFNVLNLSLVYTFVIYEGIALILTAPLILSLNKGELSK